MGAGGRLQQERERTLPGDPPPGGWPRPLPPRQGPFRSPCGQSAHPAVIPGEPEARGWGGGGAAPSRFAGSMHTQLLAAR